jgi:uncharacterized surface protein with fasciclin (FAS1) repeats
LSHECLTSRDDFASIDFFFANSYGKDANIRLASPLLYYQSRKIKKQKITKEERKMKIFKGAVGAMVISLGLALAAPVKAEMAAEKDIVDTAVSAGSFTTLVAAVKAAGLVDTLKGKGPFTVFAPTDEAFAKLPVGTVENLLKPENRSQLQAILTYHVVAGQVTASDVVNLKTAKTANGSSLKINVADGKVMVDNAQVVRTDIMASNGVIHVIDTVVIP